MKIFLNALGILIFFFSRYEGRTNKTDPFSGKRWIKENWEQLVAILLVDIALMALVFIDGLKLSFEKLPNIPEWIQLAGDGAVCLLIGSAISFFAYEGYKKLVINKRN